MNYDMKNFKFTVEATGIDCSVLDSSSLVRYLFGATLHLETVTQEHKVKLLTNIDLITAAVILQLIGSFPLRESMICYISCI